MVRLAVIAIALAAVQANRIAKDSIAEVDQHESNVVGNLMEETTAGVVAEKLMSKATTEDSLKNLMSDGATEDALKAFEEGRDNSASEDAGVVADKLMSEATTEDALKNLMSDGSTEDALKAFEEGRDNSAAEDTGVVADKLMSEATTEDVLKKLMSDAATEDAIKAFEEGRDDLTFEDAFEAHDSVGAATDADEQLMDDERLAESSGPPFLSSEEWIAYGFRPDPEGTDPNFLARVKRLFHFHDGDVDAIHLDRANFEYISESSLVSTSREVSARMRLDASCGAAFAGSVRAGMNAVSESSRRQMTEIFRSNIQKAQVTLTLSNFASRLTQNALRFFRTNSADRIIDEFGEFFAIEMKLGGAVDTVFQQVQTSSEDQRSFHAAVRANGRRLVAQASVSAEVSASSVGTSSQENLNVQVRAQGGEPAIWMGGGRGDFEEMRVEWSRSFTNSNLYPMSFQLVPIDVLVGQVDRAKGDAVAHSLRQRWRGNLARLQEMDDRPYEDRVKHGTVVHLQNQYGSSNHYYLDTCGQASCGGGSSVKGSYNNNRDRGSGSWKILKVNAQDGPVESGDLVYLQNQHGRKYYLDICGSNSCGGGYNVVASPTRTRSGATATWKIMKTQGLGEIRKNDLVYLENQYGSKKFLDICGRASCSGVGYNVVASRSRNRSRNSGTWQISFS